MAWETRKRGDRYYYRTRKVNGRVVKEYVGGGPLAEALARADRLDRERRAAARARERAEREYLERQSAELDEFDAGLTTLVAAFLCASGYHRHDRGEWRRRKA